MVDMAHLYFLTGGNEGEEGVCTLYNGVFIIIIIIITTSLEGPWLKGFPPCVFGSAAFLLRLHLLGAKGEK